MSGLGLGLGLGLAAASRAGSPAANPVSIFGFTRPAVAPTGMDALVTSQAVAEITDTAGWSVGAIADAAMTLTGGKAQASGAQSATRYFQLATPAMPSGKKLTSVVDVEAQSGNVSIAGNNATITKTGAVTAPGRYMTNLTAAAAGPVNLRESFLAGVSGIIDSAYIFDIEAMLSKKWFIILVVAQSNWVGATRTLDRTLDLPAYGCLVWPGASNPARGYVLDGSGNGVPALAVDPVMHQFPGNTGGGPAGAFLREVRRFVPDDYTPVLVATGYSGAGFAGNGLWSSGSNPRTAYDGFWKQARACWAAAPAGSCIAGIVFCQGESDLGAGQLIDWQSPVDGAVALLNEIQAEAGWQAPKGGGTSTGAIPIVISEIGGNFWDTGGANYANYADMVALQKKLATGSGDALARPRCKYVARDPSWVMYSGDGLNIHYTQAMDRIQGYAGARALHDLIYQV